ncbi:hypothetical protein B296_00025137 [Ensete ventricosum]|uniref:Uncharacterized protein n=1 Tax=Ensete ventricosum TaxID=4639 RepID=A0A426YWC7_ENSVE|nr:hypothetical protein B296_00025137 [Ensete ventricosum]
MKREGTIFGDLDAANLDESCDRRVGPVRGGLAGRGGGERRGRERTGRGEDAGRKRAGRGGGFEVGEERGSGHGDGERKRAGAGDPSDKHAVVQLSGWRKRRPTTRSLSRKGI